MIAACCYDVVDPLYGDIEGVEGNERWAEWRGEERQLDGVDKVERGTRVEQMDAQDPF